MVAAAVALNVPARIAQTSLCCADDAIFSVVAKNLAAGEGYLSTFSPYQRHGDEIRLFDPFSTTTGPTLIVPAAAMIRVAGNQYWVPGVTTALAILALLAGIAATWRRLLGRNVWWVLALLLVLLQLTSVEHYALWFTMLGELPASLLVILGASLLAPDRWRPRRVFLAGLALGCAFLTKTVAAVGIGGVVLSLAAAAALARFPSRAGPPPPAADPRTWLAVLAGLLLPNLAYEAWKLAALGGAGYLELKALERMYVSTHPGSGIDSFAREGVAGVLATLQKNWAVLVKFLGGAASALAAAAACVLGAALAWRPRAPSERLVAMLATAAAAHVGWWLALSSSGWTRHLAPGLVYLAAAAALATARWPLPGRSAAVAACVLLALAPRANRIGEVVARPPFFEPSPPTRSMLATARFLDGLPPGPPKVAISWISVQDLEYLSQSSRNFVAVRFVPPSEWPGRILVGNRRWDARTPELKEVWEQLVEDWRGEVLFEDGDYVVYRAGAETADPVQTR